MPAPSPVVGRLAPSPTGSLHLGNARTFLLAWLQARQAAGRVVLRIEDLDIPRVQPHAIQQTLDDLGWLGLDWDGPPRIQTHRRRLHAEALRSLAQVGLIYPCVCTRKDIERAASAPNRGEDAGDPGVGFGLRYPGTCRATPPSGDALQKPLAWRLRVEPGETVVADRLLGERRFDIDALYGDFVVGRKSEHLEPAYQLASVIDDAVDGVTDVLRADDLLDSSARQQLVIDALRKAGWRVPTYRYWHVPLVVDTDGRRLAKRHRDVSLASYREAGIDPTRVLAVLGEWIGLGERDAIWQPDRAAMLRDFLTRFRWATLSGEAVTQRVDDDAWIRGAARAQR